MTQMPIFYLAGNFKTKNIFGMENHKLLSLKDLLKKIEHHKKGGYKVVFTNGCFDILHKGHVAYLREAKKLGNILVLGLNSDRSVREIKGPERPINNESDRAFVLSALECIDYVVIFDEPTPYEILSQIKPDVLVKGSDYRHDEVIGSEFAGETRLIRFVEGYSTSGIIERMKN
jgi:rfaE bifunctional protein nucleotidyltransferase chain/domain